MPFKELLNSLWFTHSSVHPSFTICFFCCGHARLLHACSKEQPGWFTVRLCRQQFSCPCKHGWTASLSRCSPIKKLGFVFQLHICKLLWDTTDLYFFVSRSGMPGWRKCLVFCLQRMQGRGKARGEHDSKGEIIIEGMPLGRGWVQCFFFCS